MNIKQYWSNLQPRERHTLLFGGVVLIPLMIYALMIDPFYQELQRLEKSVANQRELLAWMQQSATEVKSFRQVQPGSQKSVSGQSLMSTIDASARSTNLSGAIKQLKPEGQGVKVRLEDASFDDMLRWLGQLNHRHGIAVSGLVMERLPQAGKVNASVVLGGEG